MPLLVLVILAGSVGVLSGNWSALAAVEVDDVPADVSDIPGDYLLLYQDAALHFGLDWSVLAAVGRVETNHGRASSDCAPNEVGARGPMQFLPSTFVRAARMAGISDPDICDPAVAIPAAGAYLRSNGAPRDWRGALFRYNPAIWYPPLVLEWARRYGYGSAVGWPLEGGRITQRFGPTAFPAEPPLCYRGTCYPHFHDGLDIAAGLGTPVRSIAAGRVTLAGRVADGAVVVIVEHTDRVSSLYGHLAPELAVREGQLVAAGDRLGVIGLTGRTTGAHLHLEVHEGGEPFDPLSILPPEE